MQRPRSQKKSRPRQGRLVRTEARCLNWARGSADDEITHVDDGDDVIVQQRGVVMRGGVCLNRGGAVRVEIAFAVIVDRGAAIAVVIGRRFAFGAIGKARGRLRAVEEPGEGVFQGDSNSPTVRPDDTIIRADVAVVVQRMKNGATNSLRILSKEEADDVANSALHDAGLLLDKEGGATGTFVNDFALYLTG